MHAPSQHVFRRLYIKDLEAMFPSEASRESERERSVAYQQYNLRDDRGYMGKEKMFFSIIE